MITVSVRSDDPRDPPAEAKGEYIVCIIADQFDPVTRYAGICCLIHGAKPEHLITVLLNLLAYAVHYAERDLELLGFREMCLEALKQDPRSMEYVK